MSGGLGGRWIFIIAGVVALLAFGGLAWIVTQDNAGQENARAIKPLGSPATARLDREMTRLLEILEKLEQGEPSSGPRCERCAYLAQTANGYGERASAALADIRQLEASLSREVRGTEETAPGRIASLQRQLAARQSTAGRSLAGLRSFADAASACEAEKLCTRDDTQRTAQTMPLDCSRDRQAVTGAATRISTLSDAIIEQARLCQAVPCPVMDCERSAALAADLKLVEISLAELAGGRTALPGTRQTGAVTGLATVLGGVERALVRLALDSAETSLSQDALSARAQDMRKGLADWVAGTELRRGVEKDSWRVSALMAEIDVAAEWALSGDTVEYTRAYFEALSRAMLSAARLDAALAMGVDAANDLRSVAGPVCGATELGSAYLKAGRAIAALGFCRAKSACERPMSFSDGSLRSASDREIGALAAVIGALPLEESRSSDAQVRSSPPAQVSMNRADYLAGEVIAVTADASPSSCLVNAGAIGLARAGTSTGREQRYQLLPGSSSEILLAAPNDPGRYVVRVFASPDRGGQLLSEHPLTVNALGPGCEGFTGIWDTQFGRLRMVERDGQISGSYRRNEKARLPGLVLGERAGRNFTGVWLSELGRGGTRLRLLESGSSFRGTWGVQPDRVSGGGAWNGDCLGG